MLYFVTSYLIILGTLLIPGGIPHVIETVEQLCLPPTVLFGAKLLVALPFTYHYINGFRHLVSLTNIFILKSDLNLFSHLNTGKFRFSNLNFLFVCSKLNIY